jgi:hypothetical protein
MLVQDGGSKEITRHAQTDSPTKWQTSSVNSLDTVSRLEIRLGLVPGFKWPAVTTDGDSYFAPGENLLDHRQIADYHGQKPEANSCFHYHESPGKSALRGHAAQSKREKSTAT